MHILSACGFVFILMVVLSGFVSVVVNVNDFEMMRDGLMVLLFHLVASVGAFEEWVPVPGHFGVESAVLIGGVVYLSGGSVGLLKFVISFHMVAIP